MGFAEGSRVGPYRIVRKIGEGGMGEVYEAIHEAIERRVALKVLHAEFMREQEIVSRFVNEARAVNRIGHPGLVQVFDYSQHADGRSYIVMEYLEGESLSARLVRSGGRLRPKEVVWLCRQIGSALTAAHAKQIIHRDLKPDNVMIVPDSEHLGAERVKLLDFGLAKFADRPGTKSDVIMGTPHYMSPEQCRGAKYATNKSDVYSLGVMLFEALSARLPFLSEGAGELVAMHLFNDPPPLVSIAPDVPARLAALVDHMLVKAADARPDVSQVMKVLSEVSEDIQETNAPAAEKGHGVAGQIAIDGAISQDALKPTLAGPQLRATMEDDDQMRSRLKTQPQDKRSTTEVVVPKKKEPLNEPEPESSSEPSPLGVSPPAAAAKQLTAVPKRIRAWTSRINLNLDGYPKYSTTFNLSKDSTFSFQNLLNAIFKLHLSRGKIKPQTYGIEWVLVDLETQRIIVNFSWIYVRDKATFELDRTWSQSCSPAEAGMRAGTEYDIISTKTSAFGILCNGEDLAKTVLNERIKLKNLLRDNILAECTTSEKLEDYKFKIIKMVTSDQNRSFDHRIFRQA